jgi:putative holliday junction resolvase
MMLGIDFGKKRIGLALGEQFPKGAGFIDGRASHEEIINQIVKICQDNEVSQIVMGVPTTNSGTGEMEKTIRDFGKKLEERSKLKINYEPENFTSVEATRILVENKVKDIKKNQIDEMAAILILEQFINERDRN